MSGTRIRMVVLHIMGIIACIYFVNLAFTLNSMYMAFVACIFAWQVGWGMTLNLFLHGTSKQRAREKMVEIVECQNLEEKEKLILDFAKELGAEIKS